MRRPRSPRLMSTRFITIGAAFALLAALSAGCLDDGRSRSADAGGLSFADAGPGGHDGRADASVPVVFERLELRVSPDSPMPEHDFSLYIRATDSEGRLYRDYQGTVSVEASDGELLGSTESQQVTQGTAFLTLRFEEPLEGVTLTVTDDDDSSIRFTTEPFDVGFTGEPGAPGEVVISEVNWYGPLANNAGTQDVWVELRNTSDREINVGQWKLEGAGIEGNDLFLFSGTVLSPGEYLVVGNFRNGGSLDGVSNVQIHLFAVPLALPNEGMALRLRDVEGTVIDRTPDPGSIGWPAGVGDRDLGYFESMERRDDVTGGGYGDGSDPAQWYTWNRGAGVDTTNPNTFDMGTPGEHNSDPSAALALPYTTSFERGDARLELLSTHEEVEVSHTPPAGTAPRSEGGSRVLTTTSLTTSLADSRMRTVDCLALDGGGDVRVTYFGMESSETENDLSNNERIALRSVIEWYADSRCETTVGSFSIESPRALPVGEYLEVQHQAPPPTGATHIKVRVEAQLSPNAKDDLWAADDLSIEQVAASE
jgi:hypothetical protein